MRIISFLVPFGVISNTRNVFSTSIDKRKTCFTDDNIHLADKYLSNRFPETEEKELMRILDSIKDACGDACKIKSNQDLIQPLQKCVDCTKLWPNQMIDRYSWSCNPIRNISHNLANLFTYNNTIDIDFMYYDDMPSLDRERNLEVKVP